METPTLKPYAELVQCVKCGTGYTITNPMMGLASIGTIYCPGGKELEEEQDKNPVEAFLSLLPAIGNLQLARKPRINICAGIGEEHLHKTCPRCGYEWLIHTKPA